jgi:CHASE2 domain-containing sensor protein
LKAHIKNFEFLLNYLAIQNSRRILWLLVGVLGLWATAHILWLPNGSEFDRNSYDQMVKRRLIAPSPDPRIIIVDIDERSLDQLKNEFGRWPWPRETLAAALDWLNHQGAQAVVFDILFADADTLNPASDAAFVQAVEDSNNSYFPVLRLNKDNDPLSQVQANQLTGFASAVNQEAAKTGPTVAVVPPVFDALVKSQRLGYHNIYADEDGVNRFYQLWEDKEGWRMWSLPARLALDLGWKLPEQPKQLIQFTRTKDAFQTVPFSEVWQRSQTADGRKQDPRFKDAIVIIGATATSLFDVKVSPLSPNHPGVMILANVVDNLKHSSFLKRTSTALQIGTAWLGLLLVAWASTKIREDQMKWAVPAAPSLFLGLSYLSLHTQSNFYLDLAPSASHALLFFTVWTLYLNWRTRYFTQPPPAPELNSDAIIYETFALLKTNFAMQDLGGLCDQLPCEAKNVNVMQLGALGQLPHLQNGLIYISLRAEGHEKGAQLLNQMILNLPYAPHAFYVSPAREPRLFASQFWETIWQDSATAQHHWKLSHASN